MQCSACGSVFHANRCFLNVVSGFAILGLVLAGTCVSGQQIVSERDALAKKPSTVQYGHLPLSFEANQGQADSRVRFTSRGEGYALSLTDSEAVLSLGRKSHDSSEAFRFPDSWKTSASGQGPVETESIRMRLVGAKSQVGVTGQEQLPGKANYFFGNDPTKWHVNVPTYGKVKYTGVYDGVDLVYYGNQRQLEYDFLVAPKADPRQIRLHFGGASKLKLVANGDLEITGRRGQVAFHKPVLYQQIENQRQTIDGRFTLLAGNIVGFAVGSYDRSQPLVIDPVLVYSTFLSGSGSPLGEFAAALAVDSNGNSYVTGTTYSNNFPVTHSPAPLQSKLGGAFSAFVSKLNADGTALLYSTYLGGPDGAGAYGLKVDSAGNAYIAGFSFGNGFPITAGAFQTASKETSASQLTGFVTKLNATGTALIYSTYLGGSGGDDTMAALAIDASGSAYVTGYTISTDFPVTKGAFQSVSKAAGAANNAFATKLNPAGTGLIYSTYLGGTKGAHGFSITADASGNAYIAGSTSSSDFPVTAGAFQTKNADTSYGVGFVTKLNPTGTAALYSTYLGGSGLANASLGDEALGIAVDSSEEAYVAGSTASVDFPVTKGAYQTTEKGLETASPTGFVTRLNAAGTGLVFSTYLGGTGQFDPSGGPAGDTPPGDSAGSIAIDASGNVFVAGGTQSSDFPVTSGAYLTANKDVTYGVGFVTELNPAGSELLYSTYFGGTAASSSQDAFLPGDSIYALALDAKDNVYIAGHTLSTDFPITNGAFQTSNNQLGEGGSAAFVAKLGFAATTGPVGTTTKLTSSVNPAPADKEVTFTAEVTTASGSAIPTGTVAFTVDGKAASTVTLSSSGEAAYIDSTLAAGTHAIAAIYSGSNDFTTSKASLTETAAAAITITATPASLTFPVTAVGATSAAQKVTIKNTGSATATIDGVGYTGSGPSYFPVMNSTCGQTLAAGATCILPISFEPQKAGISTNGLEFFSNAADSPAIVMLTGSTSATAAATPTFSPAAGSYATAQSVTLTGTTSGTTIYYTVNGTTPTTSSTKYTGPIKVASTETIEAIAVASGYTNSTVAKGTYTISAAAALTVSVSPASLTFVSLAEGATSAAQVVTVKNTGKAAVTLGATNFTGANTKSFVKSATTCGASLAAGASCTISVEFKPAATGSLSASLNVADDATGSPQLVALKGTATVASTLSISVAPASLTFASLAEGSTSAAQAVTLKNTGTAALTLGTPAFSGTNPKSFLISAKTCTASLAVAASCTLSVEFKPTVTGALSASLSIPDNVTGSPQLVTLKGTATAAGPAYTLTVTPSALTFAALVEGATSPAQIVTLKNTGTGTITLGTPTLMGTNPKSFLILAKTCTTSLAAGASCTLSIEFKPAVTGSLSASLSIADNATGSPQAVALKGTATASESATATPTFSVAAGNYTTTQSVMLKDATTGAVIYYTLNGTMPTTASTKYSAAISVSSTETIKAIAVATGSAASAVASATYTIEKIAADPTFSVAAGTYSTSQSVTLKDATTGAVIYYTLNGTTPTTASTKYSAAILVSSTETIKAIAVASGYQNSPVVSSAYTIGAVSAIVPTPASLSFPVTTMGASAPSQTITLKNTAKTQLTSLSIAITGADAASFTTTKTCGTTLAAGATCTVSVAEAPKTEGNLSATLQIAASGTGIATVSMTGFSGDPTSVAPDDYTYEINTTQGDIYIELQPQSAPKNVANFLSYVNNGTYTKSIIHRVVQGFVNQGGGYKLNSAGDVIEMPTQTPVAAEVKLSNLRGTLATASAGTNTDQFFFNVEDNTSLDTQDGGYTVFARIVGVQGVNVASDSVSLAVMDAINFDNVYTFAAPFYQIPLLNYTNGAAVEPDNYVYINSITKVTAKPDGPATPVFSIGTGTYKGPQTVSITDSTPGATIYYYLFNSNVPYATKYTQPFTISASQYVVTFAEAPGYSSPSYYNYEYIGITQ